METPGGGAYRRQDADFSITLQNDSISAAISINGHTEDPIRRLRAALQWIEESVPIIPEPETFYLIRDHCEAVVNHGDGPGVQPAFSTRSRTPGPGLADEELLPRQNGSDLFC